MTTNKTPDHQSQPGSKKNKDSQIQISSWIAAHKDSYISASIPPDRKDEIFHHGKLRPTEEVLRKDFKCTVNPKFENISRLIADYKNDSKASEKEPLPKRFVMHNHLPFHAVQDYGLLSDANYFNLIAHLFILPDTATLPAITLSDGKTHQITRNMTGNKNLLTNTFFQIEGLPYLEVFFINPSFWDLANKWTKQYDLYTDRGAQYAIDMLATPTIDSQLAIIWQTYQSYTLKPDSIRDDLFHKRSNVIQTSNSPCYYLDATKNKINWTDANTIQILRGNSENIYHNLSSYYEGQGPLLYPWENKGEMFSLDLSEENTIVIGPRKELEPYVTKNLQTMIQALNETEILPDVVTHMIESYARKYKIFYFEDMTKEQLKFFKVPAHLNPYIRKAIEKLRHVMVEPMQKSEMENKRRAFNQWRLFVESNDKKSETHVATTLPKTPSLG